jgi:hypothetical protein
MEWCDLRGRALGKEVKSTLDLKKLDLKIQYIIHKELESFESKIKIDKLNKFGYWKVI